MNILITGANGFIGNNLIELLSKNKNFNLFKGTRSTIDLYSKDNIEKYLDYNNIDAIIHCAIEGGSRLKVDDDGIFYKNLLMYENLNTFNFRYKCFINLASGAEFDRSCEIFDIKEEEISNRVPHDYYGLSKNIISKSLLNKNNSLNLRIFGCFYYNELDTRFIKNNIKRYINKKPMIIHQDKFMDFIYLEDISHIINYYLSNNIKLSSDINMSYIKKYKLSDIANIINNLSNHKVDINIECNDISLNYCGNGLKLNSLNLNLKGIELGIKECYNKMI